MNIAEKKQRAAIDQAMAKAGEDIKDAGKTFTLKFDWEAYDAIDWAKIGRDKLDYYSNELNNIASLGTGLNKLCADADYKEALAAMDTIVYRSGNDDSIRVRAKVDGTTLTIDNYTFGSTRQASDYEYAARSAF